MITLYCFRNIFPEGIGETKDFRVQWVLEETGLPYREHTLDHTAGDLDSDWYRKLNPFRQVPAIDDEGFVLTESAAIVLYLAEKAQKLIPPDVQGRTRVMQWCFAAVASVEPTLITKDFLDIFDSEKAAKALHEAVPELAKRWLGGVEERLDGRPWIVGDEFTAADIMMAGVLRTIRKQPVLLAPFPRLREYFVRCQARPAWQRTLALSAERLGVSVDAIR